MNRIKNLQLLLLLFFASGALYSQPLNWTYTSIIDDNRQSGAAPSMAVDSSGNVHILYWDNNRDLLYYGYRPAGTNQWAISPVDSTGANGAANAITLDNSGTPHIAFFENNNGNTEVRYGKRNGSTWTLTTIPNSGVGWGEYGPYADANVTARVVPGIDIAISAISGKPVIVFFGAWVVIAPYVNCYFANYDFRMYQAWVNGSGNWETRSFGKEPYISNECIDLNNTGDRYGEFPNLISTPQTGLTAITTSTFNNRIIGYNTQNSDTSWNMTVLDSMRNVSASFQGLGNWATMYISMEYIDAFSAPDQSIHISYATSWLYGNNFCCPSELELRYMRLDTNGNIFYMNLPPTGSTPYRSFTSIAATGSDSIFMIFSQPEEDLYFFAQSADSGQSWTFDTLFQVSAQYQAPLAVMNDSLYTIIFDPENERLWMLNKHISDSVWSQTKITNSEFHGSVFSSAVERNAADTVNFIFDDLYNDQLFIGKGYKTMGWTFDISLLDSVRKGFTDANLALTSAGDVAVCYISESDGHVFFSTESGAYAPELVDTVEALFCQIAVDAADTVHLVYYDHDSLALRYARKHLSAPVWTYETIHDDSIQDVGINPALTLDQMGIPHVTYHNQSKSSIRYAFRQSAGNWISEKIYGDTTTIIGNFSDIAIGQDSLPRIVFIDDVNHLLYFAEKVDTGWTLEQLDSLGHSSFGKGVDIEIDSAGNPWIAYTYFSNSERVKLIHRDSLWMEAGVNTTGQIAFDFDFDIVEADFYILGRKTQALNEGLAMLYAPGAIFIRIDEEIESVTAASVWPNPFDRQIRLSVSAEKAENAMIRITDINGRILYQEEIIVPAGKKEFLIESGIEVQGLYFMQLITESSSKTFRLVKVK